MLYWSNHLRIFSCLSCENGNWILVGPSQKVKAATQYIPYLKQRLVRKCRKQILRPSPNGTELYDLLHRSSPNIPDGCWCCQEEQGTLLHIFWSCPRIRNFWKETMQKFCDFEIPEDPDFFILHLSENPVKTYRKSILCHLVNAAKACIPFTWK